MKYELNTVWKTGWDLRAYGFREATIVEWGWIRVALNGGVVDDFIQLICGDPRSNMRSRQIQDFPPHLKLVN